MFTNFVDVSKAQDTKEGRTVYQDHPYNFQFSTEQLILQKKSRLPLRTLHIFFESNKTSKMSFTCSSLSESFINLAYGMKPSAY